MRFAFLASLLVAAVGCGDDDPSLDDDPDVHACAHLDDTTQPPIEVMATPTAAGAPAIDDDHRTYVVNISTNGIPGNGFATFVPAAAGDYNFYFADVEVTALFTSATGTTIESRSSGPLPACGRIRKRDVVTLPAGTMNLELQGVTHMFMVVEPAAPAL